MNGNNPYNCAEPGNLFVGYEDLRQDVLDGFLNGHSYSLIGSRRCGKTSLLLQLAKDIGETYKLSPLRALPRLLDIQGLDRPTPQLLFQRLYELAVDETDAPTFSPNETEGAYQQFLTALKKAATHIEQRYGPSWVVIFLIDELDAAVDSLPDDQFFQNLRHFLMMSDFRNHFRLVASGVTGMAKLISSGSSPLNNLLHKYLSLLSHQDAIQLILSGFRYVYDEELKNSLFQCTGRHPYLMQGVLEKLWKDKGTHDQAAIQRAANRFLSEHSDYRRWVESFGQAEHAVYQLLADAPGGTLTKNSIRQSLGSNMAPQVGEAQLILSYHGVIDNSDPQNPQIAGTMFRDWYQDNVPRQEKPKAAEPQRPQTIRVFYSYSHKDETLREELEAHLSLLR